ncbi:MAG: flagellar basal body P-ring formation chaperone FlgA [Balneolaceae bacterium]|nr:flagellar basal body P-ring formation chaperone FlgA [Balneolaceae bacterium]
MNSLTLNTGILALLAAALLASAPTAAAQQPVKEKLERMAAQRVAKSCHGCEIAAETRWMPNILARADSSRIRELRLPASELSRGYLTGEVTWERGGETQTSSVQLHIGVTASVPVATRRIGEGETLERGDYEMRRRDITRLRQLPAVSDSLLDRQASRMIGESDVILRTDINRPASVTPGDPVSLHYRGEGMAITIATTAREAKAPGEKIRLFSRETGKTYIAILINANEAEWERTL